jgi:Xaa-Pro aminopeptidase
MASGPESLGVRIEDMYLVTEDGAECLSARIPKTVAEIEALVGAD